MKKLILGLLTTACLCMLTFGFAACGGDTKGGNTAYRITCESGKEYTVTDLEEQASAGDVVSFGVESNSVFYTVDKVTMNGEELSGSGTYSFAMPEKDVEIKVTMSFVGEYDDPDDHLAWDASVNGTIPTASAGTTSAKILLDFVGITSGNFITSVKDEIYSSDESVIPADALEFVPEKVSLGNSIIGGYLTVDLTKVQAGETYLYVDLDPNNSSLGRLIRKFTVVPAEEIVEETMQVTFSYENKTDYSEENIFFNITDTATDKIKTIYLSDFSDGSYSFDYVVGHTYRVSCAYAVYNPETGYYEDMTNLSLYEWVGTNVGGAVNKLETIGETKSYLLELTTEGIEVNFTIND